MELIYAETKQRVFYSLASFMPWVFSLRYYRMGENYPQLSAFYLRHMLDFSVDWLQSSPERKQIVAVPLCFIISYLIFPEEKLSHDRDAGYHMRVSWYGTSIQRAHTGWGHSYRYIEQCQYLISFQGSVGNLCFFLILAFPCWDIEVTRASSLAVRS